MAALELDPVFVKALGFLRSRSKDSTEQLKVMLDEALAETGHGRFSKQDSESGKKSGAKQKEEKAPTPCIKLAATEGSRKEAERRAEKRAGEKLKSDSSDSFDPPSSKRLRSERQRKPVIEDDEDDDDDTEEDNDNEEVEEEEEESLGTEDSSHGDSNPGDSNHGSTDADDFAVEMGLACIVCKQLEVSAGNQLIECQECHSLYHQLCHKPPASEADPNDPRLVWYCSRCTRNMKKQATKKVKNSSSTSHVARESSTKEVEVKADSEVLNIFKRAEPKSTTASTSTGTASKTPYTGLASFAANLTGRSSANSKAAAASSRPPGITGKPGSKVSPVPSPVNKTTPATSAKSQPSTAKAGSGHAGKNLPQASTASAMKRLQQMKKKASSKR
ncbi:integrator complex subunit 12-like isoform X2 [Acanthaster planci]|uniref:Integrator complex subunit 12 n=1 Tax=Acanthaster planci TaxID=133434 RepID=A0A8B7Y593_ACAPL|nr:integrator complex subunit 12-like isoform X2 [Acanthaster planci]